MCSEQLDMSMDIEGNLLHTTIPGILMYLQFYRVVMMICSRAAVVEIPWDINLICPRQSECFPSEYSIGKGEGGAGQSIPF